MLDYTDARYVMQDSQMLATLKSISESNTWGTRMEKSGGNLKTKISEKIFPNMKLMSTSHIKAMFYDYLTYRP